jgi:hypothetical protein
VLPLLIAAWLQLAPVELDEGDSPTTAAAEHLAALWRSYV